MRRLKKDALFSENEFALVEQARAEENRLRRERSPFSQEMKLSEWLRNAALMRALQVLSEAGVDVSGFGLVPTPATPASPQLELDVKGKKGGRR